MYCLTRRLTIMRYVAQLPRESADSQTFSVAHVRSILRIPTYIQYVKHVYKIYSGINVTGQRIEDRLRSSVLVNLIKMETKNDQLASTAFTNCTVLRIRKGTCHRFEIRYVRTHVQ